MQTIHIRGARTHNLKNIDVDLPRDQLIVITGPSGSGKSSLAFDTLYAEGQRRYVESLSAYARQFLSIMEKPDVDVIEGLSPAISIEQKSTSHNPRSTVGTITEIHDYLRLLFARVGVAHCPTHHVPLAAQTISEMIDNISALPDNTKLMILAPVVQLRKGEHLQLLDNLRSKGFVRARINGELVELDNAPKLNLRQKHTIEVVVDRIKVQSDMRLRLSESLETALKLTEGLVHVAYMDEKKDDLVFSSTLGCIHCGYSLSELEPRLFSFNNPAGACPDCDGLGVKSFFDQHKIIHDEKLSLADGAIRGWDKRHAFYFYLLDCLAKHYKFDINTPFGKLKKSFQTILLHGSGEEKIRFRYHADSGQVYEKVQPFEGILPNMERRYRETDSQMVRDELTKYLTSQVCPICLGARLKLEARNVFIQDKNLPDICQLPIDEASRFFEKLKLSGKRGEIAKKINKEISARLQFLVNVGLDYLSLQRSADTLSGGEAQRIRLASQIGAGLVGVMYVLDEPTIGLHQRDNARLLGTLTQLRDLGNTVIVVEHDEDTIRLADNVIDIGPGAGVHGGTIVSQGTPKDIMNDPNSLTGQYLSGKKRIPVPEKRHPIDKKRCIRLSGASGHNLKNIDVIFPLGLLVCVTGVSGSGKSTLVNDTLYPLVANVLQREGCEQQPAPCVGIEGLESLDKIIAIDQSPIGRTPRSNPATYTGMFTAIRELFAGTQESRSRGYKAGRFSFNVKGGRCEACQGDGVIKVEMHFLPNVYVPCDICKGQRYNRETLEITYKHKSILDILSMTVEEARIFFDAVPVLARKLQTLLDVGLGYITLGQNATTLSGGEAQRVKLSRELSKRDTGNTLYLLDEPTTGLHFDDVRQLLQVLHRLRDHGNTIIVIEHNLDVIKTADWIIDLGPEGGGKGGNILVAGTPEQVAKNKSSYTGQFLKGLLG